MDEVTATAVDLQPAGSCPGINAAAHPYTAPTPEAAVLIAARLLMPRSRARS